MTVLKKIPLPATEGPGAEDVLHHAAVLSSQLLETVLVLLIWNKMGMGIMEEREKEGKCTNHLENIFLFLN